MRLFNYDPGVEALPEINYQELDPGIRETVRWLNDNHFYTTDSGDGMSKTEQEGWSKEEVINCPHVAIAVPGVVLVDETDRLAMVLAEAGIKISPMQMEYIPGEVVVQASYEPDLNDEMKEGMIMITGLNDEMLKKVFPNISLGRELDY